MADYLLRMSFISVGGDETNTFHEQFPEKSVTNRVEGSDVVKCVPNFLDYQSRMKSSSVRDHYGNAHTFVFCVDAQNFNAPALVAAMSVLKDNMVGKPVSIVVMNSEGLGEHKGVDAALKTYQDKGVKIHHIKDATDLPKLVPEIIQPAYEKAKEIRQVQEQQGRRPSP